MSLFDLSDTSISEQIFKRRALDISQNIKTIWQIA